MNPIEIARLLSTEDINFLIAELLKKNKVKTTLAEKLGIERKTLYNLPNTKDISVETRKKIVKYFIISDRSQIYEFVRRKLESKLSETVLDILQQKSNEIDSAKYIHQKKNILLEMKENLEKFDPLLKSNLPERYGYFLENFSMLYRKYFDPVQLFSLLLDKLSKSAEISPLSHGPLTNYIEQVQNLEYSDEIINRKSIGTFYPKTHKNRETTNISLSDSEYDTISSTC